MGRKMSTTLAILLLSITTLADGANWQIDSDHSSFQFKVRHLMVSNVRGDFSKIIKGTLSFDDQDIPNTKAEVVLDAASINTGHAKRDAFRRQPLLNKLALSGITAEKKFGQKITRAGNLSRPERALSGLRR